MTSYKYINSSIQLVVTEETNLGLYQRARNHWWYGSITAFIWGGIVVGFLALFGGSIEQSTSLVDVSGQLITIARMTSVGLGTGYYLGSSLKSRNSDEVWFLFGVFSALTYLSATTVDTLIFGQYPAYYLLISGSILTMVAHVTPFVADNDEHIELLKYLSGYASTGVVVLLAASEYVITLVFFLWDWYMSQSLPGQAIIVALILLVSVSIYQEEGENKDES